MRREQPFDEDMRTERLREQLGSVADGEFKAVLEEGLICWDHNHGPRGHDYPRSEL